MSKSFVIHVVLSSYKAWLYIYMCVCVCVCVCVKIFISCSSFLPNLPQYKKDLGQPFAQHIKWPYTIYNTYIEINTWRHCAHSIYTRVNTHINIHTYLYTHHSCLCVPPLIMLIDICIYSVHLLLSCTLLDKSPPAKQRTW